MTKSPRYLRIRRSPLAPRPSSQRRELGGLGEGAVGGVGWVREVWEGKEWGGLGGKGWGGWDGIGVGRGCG